jgi:hypothetical protein
MTFRERLRRVWILAVAVEAGETILPSHSENIYDLFRIMEVARDFPHCNAVAVDLVPMQSLYAGFDTSNPWFH